MKKLLIIACVMFAAQLVLTSVASDTVTTVTSIQAERMAQIEELTK